MVDATARNAVRGPLGVAQTAVGAFAWNTSPNGNTPLAQKSI